MVKEKQKAKWIKIILVILLFVAAGVVAFFVWKTYFSDSADSGKKDDSSSESSEESKKEDSDKKKEEEKPDEKPEEKEKVPQYDGDDPNEKDILTGAITYTGIQNQNLVIRVNIDQYVASGTCTLALRREGMTVYSTEVPIVDAASTSTCEGFDISLKGLNPGPTVIVVYLNGDGKTGELTGEVEL